MRARRHVHRTPDLTSMLDVLFILVFASLIGTAAAQKGRDEAPVAAPEDAPPVPPPVPPTPPELAALRARALESLHEELASRTALVLRVSRQGVLEAVEVEGQKLTLDVPLLEHSPDPDIGLAYLGDRSAELRLCRVAAVHLRAPDLASYLVIVAPTSPLADLPHALHRGLHRDLERCFAEQRALATIIDPEVLTTP